MQATVKLGHEHTQLATFLNLHERQSAWAVFQPEF
jgi:hypothetical protein